ncbi:zinc finger protein 658B-like [Penaeus monodon]|uniref:zinc finger protein 658B-like n=1 Tax=Penaeus monodon TaxID=6687 RepID=UPI0018A75898|nr:zinc finger protein 658B-like [Penaeus monodon]
MGDEHEKQWHFTGHSAFGNPREKPYKCGGCNKTFTVNKKLLIHRRMECEYKCHQIITRHLRMAIKKGVWKSTRNLECFTCKTIGTHEGSYKGEPFLSVRVCATPFAGKSDIGKPYEDTYKGKTYRCDHAVKDLRGKSHLRFTLKNTCKGEAFKCDICNKSFFENFVLGITC